MLYLAEANSRMKDFYDIYCLCVSFDFDGIVLHEAITQTIRRRKTTFTANPVVFNGTFANNKDKHTQWKAFCRRMSIADGLEFTDVMEILRSFLMPIYKALSTGNEFIKHWNCSKQEWV
jgi:hypothetical protein